MARCPSRSRRTGASDRRRARAGSWPLGPIMRIEWPIGSRHSSVVKRMDRHQSHVELVAVVCPRRSAPRRPSRAAGQLAVRVDADRHVLARLERHGFAVEPHPEAGQVCRLVNGARHERRVVRLVLGLDDARVFLTDRSCSADTLLARLMVWACDEMVDGRPQGGWVIEDTGHRVRGVLSGPDAADNLVGHTFGHE